MNQTTATRSDPHTQLRALYTTLLQHQDRFDEFKHLLQLYQVPTEEVEAEPADAREIREKLNTRIRDWVGTPFDALSASQVLQWRAIVVEERLNIAVAPWKESNGY